jgi:DNA-binding NarL/FixJ family response regulator
MEKSLKKWRVTAADEVDLVLAGIKAILAGWEGCEEVTLYSRLPDLLEGLKVASPDIIILGERLDPEYTTLKLVGTARAAAPHARLMLLGGLADSCAVQELFDRGLLAYLCRSDPLNESLIPALRAVMRGKPFFSPTVSAGFLSPAQVRPPHCPLDPEALLVLQLLAEGRTVSQIAAQLKVRLRHVYLVRNKLRRRFGAATNEVLLSHARAEGFVP